MRVLVVLDMEGICGITDYRQCYPAFKDYWEYGRQQITDDVNALARGLLSAGAGEVHLFDGHGYMKNVLREQVLPGAVVHDPFYVWHKVPERIRPDAVYLAGLHAHAGAPGFMPHTIAPRLRLRVNGRAIGESPWAVWGLAGLPVIGASGDAGLAESLREQLPGLRVTRVKEWVSRTEARGDAAAGRRLLAEEAAAGLRAVAQAPRFEGPTDFRLELSCGSPAAAAAVAQKVGGERTSDQVVAVRLATWGDAINFIGRSLPVLNQHSFFAEIARLQAGRSLRDSLYAGEPQIPAIQALFAEWMEQPEPEWAD